MGKCVSKASVEGEDVEDVEDELEEAEGFPTTAATAFFKRRGVRRRPRSMVAPKSGAGRVQGRGRNVLPGAVLEGTHGLVHTGLGSSSLVAPVLP
jgi:hypothetical protein